MTIPKAIREEVKIKVGDRVSFVVRDGEIVLRALRGSILDLEGSVKPRQQPEDFSAVRQDVRRSGGTGAVRVGGAADDWL